LQQATKQRIAGSVVLIALALIFLPIIFDGQGSYDTQIVSRIPPAPIIIPMANPVPTRPVIIANQPDFAAALPASDDTGLDPSEIEPTNSAVTIDSIVAAIIDESSAKRGTQTAPELGSEDSEVVDSTLGYLREAPQLGPDGLPQGWSVRLGTFSDQDNATKLLERLLNSGYKAYVRDIGREEATLTAVFVGPWLDRNRVDDYQKELQDEFELAGYVVRYTIGIP
jgi:DedD protein